MKLRGVKVIDLSMFLPGPHFTMMMADHGADVIRIEPPSGEPARVLETDGLVVGSDDHQGVVGRSRDNPGRLECKRDGQNGHHRKNEQKPGGHALNGLSGSARPVEAAKVLT